MPCSWQKEDYFSQLMCSDKRSYTALEMLVDDLHADKERTVNKFLCHSGSEDFLWGLVRLLGNDTARVAGNAAYILGTLAESEVGCMRVLCLVNASSSDSKKILPHLTRMLTFDDSESVMNAAGTMGTLAESHEGREWMLNEKCLQQTLDHITSLLHSDNLWTASNAALVLARLSISELGCSRMLDHDHSTHILSKLILSLGVDEAGRGMNAAFAIGRLCDMDQGRKRLLQLSDSERMITSLAKMLSCDDTGASKNACFALSCLATNSEGHSRLLSNKNSEEILRTLSSLLNAEDSETGWFAAMTLRTLASQPKGCLRLREHPQVISGLKGIENRDDINPDLKEEVVITLEILKRLPKPSPPTVIVMSSTMVKANWEPIVTKSGFQVRYQLFDGTKCVYTGKECECDVVGLTPCTPYIYKIRAYTEGDESPFSEIVSIITEEDVPGAPQSVRVLGATITQLKVGWDPPSDANGTLKGYYVFLDEKEVQHTTENSVILTGLTANTTYEVDVCASTSKGRGEKAGVTGTTSEVGAHAPSKPHINVIGRNELYVSWGAPEVPLGRLNRYDVIMNDRIIYSGNDLNLPVRRLVPDTEYSFIVVALTSEGKFESKMSKKRTAKDEYDQARPPLYQTPKKEEVEEKPSKTLSNQNVPSKRRKSSATHSSSAKHGTRRIGTGRERVKSGHQQHSEPRPSSGSSSITSVQDSHHGSGVMTTEKHTPALSPHLHTQSEQRQDILPAPSPSASKPVAEVKYETPVKKPRTPRSLNKAERNSQSANVQQRVVLSTVSMQNNNKTSPASSETASSKDNQPPSGINGKKVLSKNDLASVGSSMKFERSKTTIGARDMGRHRKYSNFAQNNHTDGEARTSKDLSDSLRSQRSRPNTNEREQNVVMTNSIKEKGKEKTEDINDSGNNSNNKPDVQEVTKGVESLKMTHGVMVPKTSIKGPKGSMDRMKPRLSLKGEKDAAALPKPSPPSQKYLEGSPVPSEPLWSRKSKESLDSDWLTQVKSATDSLPHPHAASSGITDSTYFIDSSHFLHRTNTYISSHRRRFLEPLPEIEPFKEQQGFEPIIDPFPGYKGFKSSHVTRPAVGRRNLEKLQKSSPGLKSGLPAKLPSSSLNFEMDIPEHTSSKLANKFIPMQLRTQPSNLGIGHLQRVNTTLMGDLTGDNSVSFKRVEAITRSHTQVDIKSGQVPMENRRDINLTGKPDRNSPGRKMSTGSTSSKVHKLGGSPLGNAARNREPDSMLLQQSWGINGGSDIGTLQNVR